MIKKIIKKIIYSAPQNFIEKIINFKSAGISPILLYHAVGEKNNNSLVKDYAHNIDQDIFNEQILALKKHFTIVPLEEILNRINDNKKIFKLAAITFDDGYRSVLTKAYPILKNHNAPSTVFISSGIVKKQIFWRDKIRWIINNNLVDKFIDFRKSADDSFNKIRTHKFYKDTKNPALMNSKLIDKTIDDFFIKINKTSEIMSAGNNIYCRENDILSSDTDLISFGNHTANHYVLSSLSDEEQYQEINDCHLFFKKLGKSPNKFFSFPFGGQAHFNETTLKIIKDLGYKGYLLSEGKINKSNNLRANTPILNIGLNRLMPANDKKTFLFQLLN